MIYIYDILLNFCDSNMIYDFYEWNTNDNIENIKRIKLIHVNRTTLDDLLNYNICLDKDFLLKIYRTCEVYTSKKVKTIDYCLLLSDGERVIAIEFDNSGNAIYKSKLLLDEEEEIAILASNLEITDISYKRYNKILENRFFTRNEFVIRKYLVKEIEECYKKKKYDKLVFLYEEYFDNKEKSYKEMLNELLTSMKISIDEKHINMYNLLKLSNKKKQV